MVPGTSVESTFRSSNVDRRLEVVAAIPGRRRYIGMLVSAFELLRAYLAEIQSWRQRMPEDWGAYSVKLGVIPKILKGVVPCSITLTRGCFS